MYSWQCYSASSLWWESTGVSLCQTGIHKLSLTKISLSDCPIYAPAQKRSASPNQPSLLPSHLSKIPASPVLIPLLRRLAYVLLAGICHSAPPHQQAEGPHQVQGESVCFGVGGLRGGYDSIQDINLGCPYENISQILSASLQFHIFTINGDWEINYCKKRS